MVDGKNITMTSIKLRSAQQPIDALSSGSCVSTVNVFKHTHTHCRFIRPHSTQFDL